MDDRAHTMNFYELSTLTVAQSGLAIVGRAVEQYVSQSEARGDLLGIWKTVVGPLNQVIVLRGFESRPDLAQERERARRSPDPFCCGDSLVGLEMASFVPFFSSSRLTAESLSHLYKMTTYNIRSAALSSLEALWHDRCEELVRGGPVIAMYPMDGALRVIELAPSVIRAQRGVSEGGLAISDDDLARFCWPATTAAILAPLNLTCPSEILPGEAALSL